MKCLPEVYGESTVATPDGKSRKKKTITIICFTFVQNAATITYG